MTSSERVMSAIPLFRVHFGDGSDVDVRAATPAAARDEARQVRRGLQITKVKIVREKVDA
jgi:hypothetical protein